ncbi:MAG: hypothetical protein NWF00_03245 [Candidatus Bathyarchaeota archaeon]|nr:hypothetical protein [Candidatus Bathyarchaeota archaeon]
MSNESSHMEPKITKEGKFMCKDDGQTYDTREEFDQHCREAHSRSPNKNW